MSSGRRLSELIHLTCFCACIRHTFCTGRRIFLPSPSAARSLSMWSQAVPNHTYGSSAPSLRLLPGHFPWLCPLLTCSWGNCNGASARAGTTRAARSRVSMGGSPLLRAMILSVDGSTESHLQHVAGPLIVTLRLA